MLTPAPPARVAADGERSLGGGIDLAVFAAQRSEQKGSALQRFGVTDGGDDDIHLGSGAGEGRQRRGDENGGDVFDRDAGRGNLQAHAQHDVGEHLGGEDGLLLISGAVETDDQAIADERIFAHSLDGGDLANAHLAREAAAASAAAKAKAAEKSNRVVQSVFMDLARLISKSQSTSTARA